MNYKKTLSENEFSNIDEFGIGASMELVEFAQLTLRTLFPNDYIDFLITVGWLSLKSDEIYGLGLDVPTRLNVVRYTLSEQMEMEPKMPQSLVALLNDGAGNHYCLDTSKLVNGICPVVYWNHEEPEDQEPEFEANSFTVWFEELISRPPYQEE